MGYQSINFIDPKWESDGGYIAVRGRKYQMIRFSSDPIKMTKSQKAYFLKEGTNAVFAPCSVCYVYSIYKGANCWRYYLYILEGWYNTKRLEILKAELKLKFEFLNNRINELEELKIKNDPGRIIIPHTKKELKKRIDRFYDRLETYLEYKTQLCKCL